MADVKWIKFVSDFFDNRKIKQIRKMPDCDAVIVIWVQILCLAGSTNDNGLVYFSKDIPYTDEMLATEFDRSAEVIRYALSIFVKFGMIEIVNDILMVSNWEKYQNQAKLEILRDHEADRKREQRKTQKRLALNVSGTCPGQVPECPHTELDLDLDKELKKEKEKPFKDIVEKVMENLNIQTGRNFKRTDAHARHIKARVNEGYKLKDFYRVIHNKTADWEDDDEKKIYLRPETLFGTKFDTYLQFDHGKRTKAELDEIINDGTNYLETMTGYWDNENSTNDRGE